MRLGTFLLIVLALVASCIVVTSSRALGDIYEATLMEDQFTPDPLDPAPLEPDRALWRVQKRGIAGEVRVEDGTLMVLPPNRERVSVETAIDVQTGRFSIDVDWRYVSGDGRPLEVSIITWPGTGEEMVAAFVYDLGGDGGWGFMRYPDDLYGSNMSNEDTAEVNVWYHVHLEFLQDTLFAEVTEDGAETPVFSGSFEATELSTYSRVRLGAHHYGGGTGTFYDDFVLKDIRPPEARPIVIQALPVQYVVEDHTRNVAYTDLIHHPSGNPYVVSILSNDSHVVRIQEFNHMVTFGFDPGDRRVTVLLEFTDGIDAVTTLVYLEVVPVNDPPVVTVNHPVDGHEYPMDTNILLEVSIEDPDDSQWELHGTVQGTDNDFVRELSDDIYHTLYRAVLLDLPSGSHELTVEVSDREYTVTSTVHFSVGAGIVDGGEQTTISDNTACAVCVAIALIVVVPLLVLWYNRRRKGGTLLAGGPQDRGPGGPLHATPTIPPTTWQPPQPSAGWTPATSVPGYRAPDAKLPQERYVYVDSDGRHVTEREESPARVPVTPVRGEQSMPVMQPPVSSQPLERDAVGVLGPIFAGEDWRVSSVDEFVDLIPELPEGFPPPLWGIDWRELGGEVVATSQLRADGLPVCYVGGRAFHADKTDMANFMQEVED